MQPPAPASWHDLDAVLTASARRAMETCVARGVIFLFDYDGPVVQARLSAPLLECLQELPSQFARQADDGYVFLSATVVWQPAGAVLRAQLSGNCVDAAAVLSPQALRRLPCVEWDPVDMTRGPLRATGHIGGGRLLLLSVPMEGSVCHLEARLESQVLSPRPAAADAQGAVAWLIAEPPYVFDSLTRRLQRLGWRTRALASCAEAGQCLAEGEESPALVMGVEPYQVRLEEFQALARSVDERCQLVFATPQARAAGRRAFAAPRVQVVVPPLSARELLDLTQGVPDARKQRSMRRSSSAIGFNDRRRVLVIDDNPVNQIIAREMVHLHGFEAVLADNGFDALAACEQAAPHAVLLDLHMPGMHGFEVTRRLRALQQAGKLPHLRSSRPPPAPLRKRSVGRRGWTLASASRSTSTPWVGC